MDKRSRGGAQENSAASLAVLLPGGITVEDIRAQVNKVLSSASFLRSERLSGFLRFTVEQTIQGRAQELKEYPIAVEVFHRPASFDPRFESIVRVEAGKLRSRLNEYYENQGQDDRLWIELPKGSYVPVFRIREPSAVKVTPARRRRLTVFAAVGLAAVAIAVLAAWRLGRSSESFEGSSLTQLTFDLGITDYPTVSPDGKLLAYASDRGGAGDFDIWVQQLAGGEPIRLTRHPADDTTPGFSPDGSRIAFRSERDGGGIYVIASSGGEETLLVRHGRSPRFRGFPSRTQPRDWYVTPIDGGPAVKTGALAWLRRHKLSNRHAEFWAAGNSILFGAMAGVSANLWQARLSPKSWQLEDAPRRLTFAAAWDGNASLAWGPGAAPASASRLVFSSLTINANVWMLPLDANRGTVTGPLRQLTAYASWGATQPCLSADGRRLVFTSSKKANDADISLKDLETGKETELVATPSEEHSPHISADGSRVSYTTDEKHKPAVYMVDPGGGAPGRICEQCYGWDVSSDGRHVVVSDLGQSPGSIVLPASFA